MINSEEVKDLLGEDSAYGFQARIAFSVADKKGFNQIRFGGVGLTLEEQDYDKEKGGWEMVECDIIIIPTAKKVLKDSSSVRNGRIDQVMQVLSEDKHWK